MITLMLLSYFPHKTGYFHHDSYPLSSQDAHPSMPATDRLSFSVQTPAEV